MATNIFYKEIVDPDDETQKIPVRIDDLFQPKDDLSAGANVSKDKEVGIKDTGRDLSNLFKLVDSHSAPSSVLGGEPTYIYGPGKKVDNLIPYGVKGVSRTRKFIREYRYWYTYETDTNILFDVPEEYRNRWMFFIVSGYNSTHRGMNESSLCGGFIPPGTTSMRAGNTAARTTNSNRHLSLMLYFCEVTIDTDVKHPTPPSGMVDLSDLYVSKQVSYPYNGPYWWVPYVYIRNADNPGSGDINNTGGVRVKKLPYGSFSWVGVGCDHDDAWMTPQKIAGGTKGVTTTELSFGAPNGRWWTGWFGLEQYRQEFYG